MRFLIGTIRISLLRDIHKIVNWLFGNMIDILQLYKEPPMDPSRAVSGGGNNKKFSLVKLQKSVTYRNAL